MALRPGPIGKVLVALLAAFITLMPTAATARSGPGPQDHGQASVHQLSAQLRQVIRLVERADLPCTTRTTMVRRLRAVDDALVSGRRTGAAGLLAAWLEGASRMGGSGVLSAQQASGLRSRLLAVEDGIGTGWPEVPAPTGKWAPQLGCASPQDLGNVGAYDPFQVSDVKFVVQFLVVQMPVVGKFLGPLVMILWPTSDPTENIASMISEAVSAHVREELTIKLNAESAVLDAFLSDEEAMSTACQVDPEGTSCASTTAVVAQEWINIRDQFIADEQSFQWNVDTDYRVDLLPLYAQWESLFLTFLREGYLAGPSWGWDAPTRDYYVTKYIDLQFKSPDHGVQYVDARYAQGLPPDSTETTGWTERNAYARTMTLGVKVFQDMWPFLDPRTYPNGNPDFVDTRIVYSDPVGEAHSDVVAPANPQHALSRLSYSELEVTTVGRYGDGFIQQLTADNAPDAGTPSGNESTNGGTPYTFDTRPAADVPNAKAGPIVTAGASTDQRGFIYPDWIAAGLSLTFANGTTHTDGGWLNYQHHEYTFAYDDMVLATARLMGPLTTHYGGPCSDSIIFGFRYSDSFTG